MRQILSTGLKLTPLAFLAYSYCSSELKNEDTDATGLSNFKGFKTR